MYVRGKILARDARFRAEHERFTKQRLMLVYDSIIYRQPTTSQVVLCLVASTQRSLRHRLGLSKSSGRLDNKPWLPNCRAAAETLRNDELAKSGI